MLVVPIAKDSIKTKDGIKYKVVEYTNYKDGGPAVYCKSKGSKEISLIYFFDIAEINGTAVEYNKSTKVFTAMGKIGRAQQLPQPDDKVTVFTDKSVFEESKKIVEIESLKLKSKSLGVNKGLFIKDTDGNFYRLKQIIDLQPSLGTHTFARDEFISTYKEYLGV